MQPSHKQGLAQIVYVVLASALTLMWIGYNAPEIWSTIVLFTLAWICGDWLSEIFESRAERDTHILNFRVERTSIAYVTHFIGIVIAAILSEPAAKVLLALMGGFTVLASDKATAYVTGVSIVTAYLVYRDLRFKGTIDSGEKTQQTNKNNSHEFEANSN